MCNRGPTFVRSSGTARDNLSRGAMCDALAVGYGFSYTAENRFRLSVSSNVEYVGLVKCPFASSAVIISCVHSCCEIIISWKIFY